MPSRCKRALATVAGQADRTYVSGMSGHDVPAGNVPAHAGASRMLVAVAAAAGVMLAATLALWAHYGSAVFYEMIVAGIALCF